MWRRFFRLVAGALVAFSISGFALAFGLASYPIDWLDAIELPNALGSVRVTAPDGRVFVASVPLGRVQRYGPDGFERGFPVDVKGGYFDIGIARSGNVLICSARGHALITYTPDGLRIGNSVPCKYSDGNGGRVQGTVLSDASDARVPFIAFGWLGLLAVPLWHPFTAWLFCLVGGLILKFSRPRSIKPASGA